MNAHTFSLKKQWNRLWFSFSSLLSVSVDSGVTPAFGVGDGWLLNAEENVGAGKSLSSVASSNSGAVILSLFLRVYRKAGTAERDRTRLFMVGYGDTIGVFITVES